MKSVTVETNYIFNVKTVTLKTKAVPNTKDKYVGNYNTDFEKCSAKYFKEQFKL